MSIAPAAWLLLALTTAAAPAPPDAEKLRPLDRFLGEWTATFPGNTPSTVRIKYAAILDGAAVTYTCEVVADGKTTYGHHAILSWNCEFKAVNHDGSTQAGTSTKTFKDKDAYTETIVMRAADGQPSGEPIVLEFKRAK
jgi:hypothetical protein